MMNADEMNERFTRLEAAAGATVPGTILSRTLMDVRLFAEYGMEAPASEGAVEVWSLGIGAPWEPKRFFYGITIKQALERAEAYYHLEAK